MGCNYVNIKNLSDILGSSSIDLPKVCKIAALLGNRGDFFKELVIAKSSYDFDFFSKMDLGKNSDSEYFDYDLFPAEGIVIDAGSYDGDTAKKMAKYMNTRSKIYSFDASLKYVKIANRLPCIDYIQMALYKKDGFLGFHEYPGSEAPGSFVHEVVSGNDVAVVSATSIDSFVQLKHLQQLDFIKMDIEGSEINAIIGAKNTIRDFRPPMAISIYHKLSDHWEIPLLILEYYSDYEIFIGHYSNNFDSTIMYFKPPIL
jgi:FkbM family methyltransferase